MKREKKIIILLSSLVCILTIFSTVLVIKEGYVNKVLAHLGIVEKKIEKNWAVYSWQSCLENLNLDADIVFFGDSITRGSHFQDYFTDVSIVNLGYSGDSLSGMRERIDSIKAVNPEKIFIMAGINGLNERTKDRTVQNYQRLIDSIISELPDAKIYIQSILPVNTDITKKYASNDTIREVNSMLNNMANEYDIDFIDVYSVYEEDGSLSKDVTTDGVHLVYDAYDRWAERIKEYIYE